MNYYVVTREDELSRSLTAGLHARAAESGMLLNEEEPDFVVSIGGDGTLLKAFHLFDKHLERAAFVGVHTGHLGFYADWMPSELGQLIDLMQMPVEESKVKLVNYPLVEVEVTSRSGIVDRYLALNEFALKGIESTLVAQLNINHEGFEMFRGDGICISTPSGSTAYSKALGGALIHPSLEAIQISEIASINNRVYRTLGSSMILPKHHHCEILPRGDGKLLLSIDHMHVERNDILSIRARVAPQKVRFARFRPFPFWSRVREAFVGHEMS